MTREQSSATELLPPLPLPLAQPTLQEAEQPTSHQAVNQLPSQERPTSGSESPSVDVSCRWPSQLLLRLTCQSAGPLEPPLLKLSSSSSPSLLLLPPSSLLPPPPPLLRCRRGD